MGKIGKSQGPTVSLARTRRGGIVAAVADVETGAVVAVGVEVPTGSVSVIVEWIGNDLVHAEAAAGHQFKGVRDAAAAVLDG